MKQKTDREKRAVKLRKLQRAEAQRRIDEALQACRGASAPFRRLTAALAEGGKFLEEAKEILDIAAAIEAAFGRGRAFDLDSIVGEADAS